MELLPLLAVVLLSLAVANGRSFEDRRDSDLLSDPENQGLKNHGTEMRHRKRRWQMNYGYDYPPPPSYYPDRRDYDNQDLLPKIVRLLEEISYTVRRPQAPQQPQPIYIPYPVPYYVPQFAPCSPPTDEKNLTITSRFPDLEDVNQNWGFVLNPKDIMPLPGDGIRPISFEPIKPIRPTQRPSPGVEHGSVQKNTQHTTQAPRFEHNSDSTERSGRSPDMCHAAILSCCTGDQRSQVECFSNFSCSRTINIDKLCSSESINDALETFKAAYSPV